MKVHGKLQASSDLSSMKDLWLLSERRLDGLRGALDTVADRKSSAVCPSDTCLSKVEVGWTHKAT
jgi:hypothetical protein